MECAQLIVRLMKQISSGMPCLFLKPILFPAMICHSVVNRTDLGGSGLVKVPAHCGSYFITGLLHYFNALIVRDDLVFYS